MAYHYTAAHARRLQTLASDPTLRPSSVLERICEREKPCITPDDIRHNPSHAQKITELRKTAAYLLCFFTYSPKEIGHYLQKDRSTIAIHIKIIRERMRSLGITPTFNDYLPAHILELSQAHETPTSDVLDRLCEPELFTIDDVQGARRSKRLAQLRQGAYYILYQRYNSLTEIGRRIGSRDHTTVLSGLRRITPHIKALMHPTMPIRA